MKSNNGKVTDRIYRKQNPEAEAHDYDRSTSLHASQEQKTYPGCTLDYTDGSSTPVVPCMVSDCGRSCVP
jgi:hypothetical protein